MTTIPFTFKFDLLGGFLDDLASAATKVIDKAGSQARTTASHIINEAAEAFRVCIANAKAAYDDSLMKTANELDAAMRKTVIALHEFLVTLQSGSAQLLERFQDSLENIVAMLPLSNDRPRVDRWNHSSFVPERHQNFVLVTAVGRFPFAEQMDHRPELVVNGIVCTLVQNTTTSLSFQIPTSRDKIGDQIHLVGQLKLWTKSTSWVVFTKWQPVQFDVYLTVLPRVAGKLVISYVHGATPQDFEYRTPNVGVADVGRFQQWFGKFYVTPGRTLVRGSCRINWLDRRGRTGASIQDDSGNTISFEWSSEHGSGNFNIICTERIIIPESTRQETVEVAWGARNRFVPQPGEVINSITFYPFNRPDVAPLVFSPNITHADTLITILAEPGGVVTITTLDESNLLFYNSPLTQSLVPFSDVAVPSLNEASSSSSNDVATSSAPQEN